MSTMLDINSELRQTHHNFRLLTLHPSNGGVAISCGLATVALLNSSRYEALSYAWGDANDRTDILVNNTIVSITRSLFVALLHLRHSEKPRSLWIDAICIDQNNIPERNQQVKSMGQVYASAERVLVWLGEEAQATKWAITQMKSSRLDLERLDRSTMLKVGKVMYRLQERPWFNRVWVFQEFALGGRDPLLLVGSSWIHWTQFMSAWEFLYTRFTGKADFHTSTTLLLSTLRQCFHGPQAKPPVWQYIVRTRKCLATDPRDHVFAIRGLLPADMQHILVPDYKKSKDEVYTCFVSCLFAKRLGTIMMSYYRFTPDDWGSMSSWVPDLAAQSLVTADGIDPRHLVPKGFHRYAANGTILGDGKTLRMTGFVVGEIDDIMRPTGKKTRMKVLSAIQHFADIAARKGMRSSSILKSFQSEEPLWKTLVADNGPRGENAPESYAACFELLRLGAHLPETEKRPTTGSSFAPLDFTFEQQLERRSRYPIFSTNNGFIGLGMPYIQKGDEVVLLFGCSTPWAVRYVGGYWKLVGQLYVGGITSVKSVGEVYNIAQLESRCFDIR